jgi:microcystin-dependent protein
LSDPYVGQISTFSFSFPPKNYAFCNGQTLPIQQNMALFSLLGTQFGGNGSTNFALPNLQGCVVTHAGGTAQGQVGGEAFHTLSVSELPGHIHGALGSGATGVTASPSPNSRLGASSPGSLYGPPTNMLPFASAAIGPTGDSQPHENRQPFLAINFCIALNGTYPSRN